MKILNRNNSLDSLRGVAVLLVIFFHLEKFLVTDVYFFNGGYIGVDIFFVISGYILTKQIIFEKINNNYIDLQNFIFRRVRRLLPTLLIMLIISSIVIYVFFFGKIMQMNFIRQFFIQFFLFIILN